MTALFFGGVMILLPLVGVRSRWLPSIWGDHPSLPSLPHILPWQEAPQAEDQSQQTIGHSLIALFKTPMPAHLMVPVSGVSPRTLSDSFGAPRSGGRRHEGIDIFAPRYTPVLSATPGLIIKVGTNRLGGNVVKVLGPAGYVHYYAHLSAFGSKHNYEWVQAGDVIGYVGNSGDARTTPSHLHYGIYRILDGHIYHAIDPYPYLAASPATPPALANLPPPPPLPPLYGTRLPALR